MILLESEASLKGEGCTAPPKTCNTGKLQNNQMVVTKTQIYMDLSYIDPQARVLNYCFKE